MNDAPLPREAAAERPWLNLVYLVFAWLPLLFARDAAAMWLPTLLATLVFLPIYFGAHARGRGPAWPWLLAIAAIGYVLMPWNPGGNTFVIYAQAMAAATLAPRRAIMLGVLLLLAMCVQFVLIFPTLKLALAMSAVMATMGVTVAGGILFARAKERRDAELRLTQDEVRRLAGMAERERIGRDLHDLLGHTLSVIALKSELARKLIERDPVAAREQIADVEGVARQALAQVREAVAGIRAAGLQAELASARLALLAADVRLDQRLEPVAIDAPVEQALALAVRESVTNVIRHAHAHRVEVELGVDQGGVRLSIADDGRGGAPSDPRAARSGNGLCGMRERLAAIGGTLEVESAAASGTRLTMRVPAAVPA